MTILTWDFKWIRCHKTCPPKDFANKKCGSPPQKIPFFAMKFYFIHIGTLMYCFFFYKAKGFLQHSPARFTPLNLIDWLWGGILLKIYLPRQPRIPGLQMKVYSRYPGSSLLKGAIYGIHASYTACGRPHFLPNNRLCSYHRLSNGSTNYERSNEKSWKR